MEPIFCDDNNQNVDDFNEWIRFGMRLSVSAALHPFEYSKTLIQLGYEPIPPYPSTSIFGKPKLALPNIIQYVGYIRKVDGFYGCYRGLTPRLLGTVLSTLVSERVAGRLGLMCQNESEKDYVYEEDMYIEFRRNLKRDVVLTISGAVVAQPFYVISIRMMAQFVGRETLYDNIFVSIKEIYKTEGLSGFFSGLIPKLIAELSCLVLTSSIVYILNKYWIKDKIYRQYNAGIMQFIISSILYPWQLVSTCMTVTGSRLMAGRPPIMPQYRDWRACWKDLQARGELTRGSSMFRRSAVSINKKHITRYEAIPMPAVSQYYKSG